VLSLSIIFGGIWYVWDSVTAFLIHGREDVFREKTFILILYYVVWGGVTLATWCAVYLAIKLWRNWEDEKLQLKESEKLVVSAKLSALRYQLNPHFLFNSLSSLRVMVQRNPKTAQDMIGKISEFMRYSLTDIERTHVELSDEIQMVKAYLDIEKVRFDDDLDVEFNIDSLAEKISCSAVDTKSNCRECRKVRI
jgi:two-component system LytT family sensor kinase